MTDDVLDRLHRHDPAADLDASPPDELFARLLAEPRTAPANSGGPLMRSRPVRITMAVAVTIALLVGVSIGRDGGATPDLAARAYAQTDAASRILHVVLRTHTVFPGDEIPDTRSTTERWVYGDETHTVLTQFDAKGRETFTSDQLLGADGVIHNHLSDTGETQTVKPSDGAEAREIIAHSRRDIVADFRSRYERGVLDEAGTTMFEGRRARRYVVDASATSPGGRKGPAQREEYFLDAATGTPLGWVAEMAIYSLPKDGAVPTHDGKIHGRRLGLMRSTVVVERIERLPATQANLAKVRER